MLSHFFNRKKIEFEQHSMKKLQHNILITNIKPKNQHVVIKPLSPEITSPTFVKATGSLT